MTTIAYTVASFLSFMPEYWRDMFIGAFAVLAIFILIKIVIAVLDAIPFL